jgi:primosomal protein N' (replication factor Y) (superfamily II helicase)
MAWRVSVAVPVPSLPALTYRVAGEVEPLRGARAVVTVGRRVVTGVIVSVEREARPGRPAPARDAGLSRPVAPSAIKDVDRLLDDDAFLPGPVVDLALWVADYYMCAPGEALAAALPPSTTVRSRARVVITDAGRELARSPLHTLDALTRALLDSTEAAPMSPAVLATRAAGGAPAGAARACRLREARLRLRSLEREGLVRIEHELTGRSSAFRTVRVAHATAAAHEPGVVDALPDRQREALHSLLIAGDGVETPEFAARGITPAAVAGLARKGLVAFTTVHVDRDPFVDEGRVAAREAEKALVEATADQEEALATLRALSALGEFRVALLHGVTGSGKTEVYRRLAQTVVAAGRRVLILVPEIALTPAVAATFRHTFGDRVAIQHSGLSDGERHDQWHRIRRGDVDVVVGTRSAVFAPHSAPGLIIVDEEHDTSYKQEEAPRYHGRDVAIVRGRAAGALVVLGSATPSLETYHNALAGRYSSVVMARRVLDRPLADVRVVNMRDEYADEGPDVVLSRTLRESLVACVSRGEQAIVLLNRRGFATSIFCRQCGGTLECPNCSVTLTVHRAIERGRCHYCDHSVRLPDRCATCGAEYLEYTGFGTERVESELLAAVEGLRVARVDRDTMRRKGEIARLLSRFAAHDLDVLVGTQMIAKGHDFPAVTLVGVVSADVGLGLADFRASERTFQLLTQVAGRAGRGERPGEAIIQTLFPEHYSIVHATAQDYVAFYEREIAYRQAMRYPPVVSLVNVIVRAPTAARAIDEARRLADRVRAARGRFRVLGPAPAPLGRLRGEHRAQFFMKGQERRAMREALGAALDALPEIRRRAVVDVDPLSVL